MTQQVGATEHRLEKQLERLRGIEKSEIRMIEADRQRFRMKYRKRDFPKASTVKDAKINDPAALGLDDHRQTIATNNRNQSAKKFLEESDYEAVRSLIFTGGQVDLDKILCLHLLSVHVIDIDEAELHRVIPQINGQSPRVEESENDILPCYVVEIQQRDEPSSSSSQFHKRLARQEEQVSHRPPEGRLGHRLQSDGGALLRGMPAPSAAGKMPIVSPPLYNNLLESHARRGNANILPSLEHLQKYIHTGQMFNKFDEKTGGDKLQREQSSSRWDTLGKRSVCRNEKYFVCSESSSAVPKSPRSQCRRILICFNTQLKNFVQTVVEILRNVNCEKTSALLDMLKSPQIVAAKLSEMEDFISSLENFSFVSLPESFTCIPGYATEDAQSVDGKTSKQPVAETLILESDASVFNSLLENIRQAIGDFWKKPSMNSTSIDSLLDNVSTTSVPSQTNTVIKKPSAMSCSVGKPVEKIASNESTTKSYDSIQQEFNEAASARLAKSTKKSSLYTDPDRVILRRMTNSQRILVGQMCAALKTRKINNEGMVKEKIPLPALLKPVLSQESINYLTQGTIYAKDNNVDAAKVESKTQTFASCINLTDFILTKIYHEIIQVENRSQLQNFMNGTI